MAEGTQESALVRLYEAMWVVDANLGRDDFSKVKSMIQELVEKGGGTLVNCEKWEERRLSYSIARKKRGLYVLSHFNSDPERVARIQRNALLSENILRVLITRDEDGLVTAPAPGPVEEDDRYGRRRDRDGRDRDRGGRDRDRDRESDRRGSDDGPRQEGPK